MSIIESFLPMWALSSFGILIIGIVMLGVTKRKYWQDIIWGALTSLILIVAINSVISIINGSSDSAKQPIVYCLKLADESQFETIKFNDDNDVFMWESNGKQYLTNQGYLLVEGKCNE